MPKETVAQKIQDLVDLAKAGWPLFPIVEGGKKPLTSHGLKDASIDPKVITAWCKKFPKANWAVRTGSEESGGAGLVVIDIDHKSNGFHNWEQLLAANSKIPPTVSAKSGGAGMHLYFKYPNSRTKIKSGANVLARGIDIRADGGYIIIPPSKTTGPYIWISPPADGLITDLPEWVCKPVDPKPHPDEAKAGVSRRPPQKDLDYWLDKFLAQAIVGRRNETGFNLACQIRDAGYSQSECEALPYPEGCPQGEDKYTRVEWVESVKSAYATAPRKPAKKQGVPARTVSRENVPEPETRPVFVDVTDVANAYRFQNLYRDRARYCKGLDTWLIWDGKRWRKDDIYHVIKLALKVADVIHNEADIATDTEARKILAKGWVAAKDTYNIESFLKLARSLLPIRAEELDKATSCLNVSNGILAMATGELTPHDPARYITKLLPVEYLPRAACPGWDAFLEERVPKAENREYLQRIIGYALSGRSDGKRVPFIFGSPDTGKSTFLETIKQVTGDYCQKTSIELILAGKYGGTGEGPTPFLRQLFGARMVIASEIPKGRWVNDGIFKDLSGSDSFTARGLHEAPVTDRPTHCLVLYGNEKPKFKDLSGATANRMAIVGFNVIIPPEIRRDMLDVIAGFMKESSGILNWIVEGYQHYQKNGLRDTEDVAAARREYETEQDVIQRFLGEQCEFHDDYSILKADLYKEYKEWCEASNEHPESRAAFIREVIRKGYEAYGDGAHKLKGIKVHGGLPQMEN